MESRKIDAVVKSEEVVKMVPVTETVEKVVSPERYECVFQNKEALQFLANIIGRTSEGQREREFGLSSAASQELADFFYCTVGHKGMIERGDNHSAKLVKNPSCF